MNKKSRNRVHDKKTVTLPWAGSVFNNIFILLGLEVAFFVSNFSKSIRDAEEQKRLALQYKYDSLKAQVNPHFLFNSLNILYSLVSIDPEKSKEFILSLSGMYRYIISQQGRDSAFQPSLPCRSGHQLHTLGTKSQRDGRFLQNGTVVICHDGKMYDVYGKLIK